MRREFDPDRIIIEPEDRTYERLKHSMTLVVKGGGGDDLASLVLASAKLSYEYKCPVQFEFNGSTITVRDNTV